MADPSEFRYSLRIDPSRPFSIIRFPNDARILGALTKFASGLSHEEFFSLTWTPHEISVIQVTKYPTFPQEVGEGAAQAVQVEEGFVLIEVLPEVGGQIDFAVTGLLAQLATILAEKGISIFAISTFDTDYILIRADNVDRAVKGFEKQGIEVSGL